MKKGEKPKSDKSKHNIYYGKKKPVVQVTVIEDIQINMRSLRRRPVPEDLIGLAVFLASEDSRNITGQLIVSDCGMNFH